MPLSIPSLLLVLTITLPTAALQTSASGTLAQAQELLDADQPEQAIMVLDDLLTQEPTNANALLARSTAYFLLGEMQAGEQDLFRAVDLDPSLRQGWLNVGGLLLSRQDFKGALEAFEVARKLAPDELDNELNIGAVLLLEGRLPEASPHFDRYVERAEDGAEANYLVSTNYALAGYAALAIRHLQAAIALNERVRLRARTDPNFGSVAEDPRYQDILSRDDYRPAPGSYSARQTFDTPYEMTKGKLLGATIDALNRMQLPFSRLIEVTPSWALIWGDLRIKVHQSGVRGVVEISAPPGSFTPADWQTRAETFFAHVKYELAPKIPDIER